MFFQKNKNKIRDQYQSVGTNIKKNVESAGTNDIFKLKNKE